MGVEPRATTVPKPTPRARGVVPRLARWAPRGPQELRGRPPRTGARGTPTARRGRGRSTTAGPCDPVTAHLGPPETMNSNTARDPQRAGLLPCDGEFVQMSGMARPHELFAPRCGPQQLDPSKTDSDYGADTRRASLGGGVAHMIAPLNERSQRTY